MRQLVRTEWLSHCVHRCRQMELLHAKEHSVTEQLREEVANSVTTVAALNNLSHCCCRWTYTVAALLLQVALLVITPLCRDKNTSADPLYSPALTAALQVMQLRSALAAAPIHAADAAPPAQCPAVPQLPTVPQLRLGSPGARAIKGAMPEVDLAAHGSCVLCMCVRRDR